MSDKNQKATVDGFMGKIEVAQRLKDTRDICRKLTQGASRRSPENCGGNFEN